MLLRLVAVRHDAGDRDDAEIDDAPRVRPRLGRIARGIAGACHLHLEMERHRPALQSLREFARQEVRRALGGIRGRDVHHAVRHRLIAHRLALAGLVDEDERVDAEIGLVGVAVRRRHGGGGGGHRRMRGDERVEFRRFWSAGRTGGDRQEQVTKIFARGHDEELQRVDHHVGLAAVRQVEFDRHAVRVGRVGAVGQVRNAGRIGEPHGDRDRGTAEDRGLAQRRGSGRRLECALGHDALGVVRAKARMHAERLVEGIDDLDLERLVVGPCRARGRDGEHEQRSGNGSQLHRWLLMAGRNDCRAATACIVRAKRAAFGTGVASPPARFTPPNSSAHRGTAGRYPSAAPSAFPSTRSEMMLRWISSVPPAIDPAGTLTRISAISPSIGPSSPLSIASAPEINV